MTRPLRLEFAGALYHVTARGDRRENIYDSSKDRLSFLEVLGSVCDECNWLCHAYCLMDNHYHLIVETPDANLSRGMRQLNGIYSQRFNRAHNREGHCFQGRYTAIHVDKKSYLLELARYVVLNPVRAEMVHTAGEWPWSSYRATIGKVKRFEWLQTDWLLASFGGTSKTAIEAYKKFVSEGKGQPSPWQELRNQVYLGGTEFISQMQGLIEGDKELSEIPISQRRPRPLAIKNYESSALNRDDAIYLTYLSGGYTLKEIGDYFGLHYSRVSRIVKRAKGNV
jgi:REP element-mobilizing transposase RayT